MSDEVKEVVEIFPEFKSLQLTSNVNQLVARMPEHKEMIATIQASLPEVQRSTSLFCKTQSQFMDNMLTVSHPTPLRNIRQILAEMNKTREAIKELHFKTRKREVELKIKQREFDKEEDELKRELIEIEIFEAMSNIETATGYLSGAIRKLANYTEQYNNIIKKHNLENFNEADFEKEEEKYHIMKAFEQAMCAARSHNGVIDEGNMIYLTQIGINGAGAQREITDYLIVEQQLLKEGKEPTHKMFLMFLERMAQKYQGTATKYAEHKGMQGTVTEKALLQKGDLSAMKAAEEAQEDNI